MRVLVTGADGFVGSHVVSALVIEGHRVSGLVRSEEAAERVRGLGAEPLRGDLDALAGSDDWWREPDVFVHLAAISPEVERRLVAAVGRRLAAGQRWIHTAGIWMYGATHHLTETTPLRPPAAAAWRVEVVDGLRRFADSHDVRFISPAVVHGVGRCASLERLWTGALAARAVPTIQTIGTGRQHWPTVHVTDLARLYALLATTSSPQRELIGASGQNPTVLALCQALGRRTGGDHEVVTESSGDAIARIGPAAEAALLDQQATGTTARTLGWRPVEPSLLAEIGTGRYDAILERGSAEDERT